MQKILNLCVCDWNGIPEQAVDGPIFTTARCDNKITNNRELASKADSGIVDTLFYTGIIDMNMNEIFMNIYVNESERFVNAIKEACSEWGITYKLINL